MIKYVILREYWDVRPDYNNVYDEPYLVVKYFAENNGATHPGKLYMVRTKEAAKKFDDKPSAEKFIKDRKLKHVVVDEFKTVFPRQIGQVG